MQINWSREETSKPYMVKISLLMLYVPKHWFSASECVENMIFLQSNMSYSIQNMESCSGRKQEALQFGCDHRPASHSHTTLCSRLTQVLVVGTSYCLMDLLWGVCVADLHAVCVFTWSIVVPSQRHSQSQGQQKQHSPHRYSLCLMNFIQQKRRPCYST